MAKQSSASSRRVRLARATSADIRNRRWTEAEKELLRGIAARQAAGDDSGIGCSDIPALTDEQLAAMAPLRARVTTTPISLRVRNDVLEWLKSKGPGHLTRINAILANVMEAERRVKKSA